MKLNCTIIFIFFLKIRKTYMKKIAHFAGEWVKSNFLGERDLNNNKIQKAVIINFPSLLSAGCWSWQPQIKLVQFRNPQPQHSHLLQRRWRCDLIFLNVSIKITIKSYDIFMRIWSNKVPKSKKFITGIKLNFIKFCQKPLKTTLKWRHSIHICSLICMCEVIKISII